MKKMQLTKTCIICGEKKSLAAFLQMSDSQGTEYGNICTTCRGPDAKLNEAVVLIEDEGSTSSGLRIDTDHRNLAELTEKERLTLQLERAREELQKKNQFSQEKNDFIEKKQKSEKEHRLLLEAKRKQGFLRFRPDNLETKQISLNQELLTDEKLKSDTNNQNIQTQKDIQDNKLQIEANILKTPDTQDAVSTDFTLDKNTQTSTQGVRSSAKTQEKKRVIEKQHLQKDFFQKQHDSKRLFNHKKEVAAKKIEPRQQNRKGVKP